MTVRHSPLFEQTYCNIKHVLSIQYRQDIR